MMVEENDVKRTSHVGRGLLWILGGLGLYSAICLGQLWDGEDRGVVVVRLIVPWYLYLRASK
jgi:hypothetical protein